MSPRPDQGTGDCNLQMPVVRPETPPPERLAKSVEIYGLLTGHRQARFKADLSRLSRARQTWTGKGLDLCYKWKDETV